MEKGVRFIGRHYSDSPNLKRLIVESNIPEKLAPLKDISRNIWWVWNTKARQLFEYIDPILWDQSAHNPIVLLEEVNYNRFIELAKDDEFIYKMEWVANELKTYLAERPAAESSKIAYFSMEYGLHDSLKIFSGGLGVLAGDYLKEASDSKMNIRGVGLLYR